MVFRVELPAGAEGSLELFDVAGRRVRSFAVDGAQPVQSVLWDGTDDSGRLQMPGVYFMRLESEGMIRTIRGVLLR
jgi:hypothetical protein